MTYYLLATSHGFADHVAQYSQADLEEVFTPMARRALAEGHTVDLKGVRYIDMVVAAKAAMVKGA
jgi:hypothetical protein